MKKFFISTFILFAIVSVQSSCKKYLEEKSDAGLLVPTTLADFQNLMDDANTMNNTAPSFGASSADEYFLEPTNYNSKSIFLQHVYRREIYPYNYSNDWSECYRIIYVSNICLERIQLLERTALNQKDWDHIKGSALFYKAYYNLELAWLFAKTYDENTASTDYGIVLRNVSDFMVPSVRATVQETYDKIIADAKEAAGLLANQPQVVTRPSACAAYALLARTYLSMRQYDSAGVFAGKALNLKSSLMNYNNAAVVATAAANPFKLFNEEVIFHASMGLTYSLHGPSAGPGRVDTNLYQAYHVNDIRRKAYFTAVGNYQRFKGSYSADASRLFSGIATDEIYLIRAECNARAGQNAAALDDLNTLLKERFAPANFTPVATVASATLDTILWERRKELLFRGSLRWMDVKRLNKEGRNIELSRLIGGQLYVLPPNDKRYALQLPVDIIEATGMPQN